MEKGMSTTMHAFSEPRMTAFPCSIMDFKEIDRVFSMP